MGRFLPVTQDDTPRHFEPAQVALNLREIGFVEFATLGASESEIAHALDLSNEHLTVDLEERIRPDTYPDVELDRVAALVRPDQRHAGRNEPLEDCILDTVAQIENHQRPRL